MKKIFEKDDFYLVLSRSLTYDERLEFSKVTFKSNVVLKDRVVVMLGFEIEQDMLRLYFKYMETGNTMSLDKELISSIRSLDNTVIIVDDDNVLINSKLGSAKFISEYNVEKFAKTVVDLMPRTCNTCSFARSNYCANDDRIPDILDLFNLNNRFDILSIIDGKDTGNYCPYWQVGLYGYLQKTVNFICGFCFCVKRTQ